VGRLAKFHDLSKGTAAFLQHMSPQVAGCRARDWRVAVEFDNKIGRSRGVAEAE